MNSNLKQVFAYFDYFSYDPSFDEIHSFYPKKITKEELTEMLFDLIKYKKIKTYSTKTVKNVHLERINNVFNIFCHLKFVFGNLRFYTLPQYSINHKVQIKKQNLKYFKQIVRKVQKYIQFISLLPTVRFIAITGSSAMLHASPSGDLDLFIITKHRTLWATRALLVLLAKLMGVYGSHICLNLFFDEAYLKVPRIKQNVYVAHEILQMRVLFDKNRIYDRFIDSNRWIYNLLPNTRSQSLMHTASAKVGSGGIFGGIESICQMTQTAIIRRNKTGYKISNKQLWLFRTDYEDRLRLSRLIK